MQLSAKVQYGCLALMELARDGYSEEGLPYRSISELAATCEVPEPYLLQVLLRLKSAGLMESRRGNTGGYRLATAPERITLDDVVRALEGTSNAHSTATYGRKTGLSSLTRAWEAASAAWREAMRLTTVADLMDWEDEARRSGDAMYHI